MKRDKLKIVFKEVGKRPVTMRVEDTLEAMQKLVDGLIEVVPYKDDMLLICNEEGKIYNLPKNVRFPYDSIMGNFFVVGDDWENAGFKSLTSKEIREAKMELNSKAILYKDIEYSSIDDEEMEAD